MTSSPSEPTNRKSLIETLSALLMAFATLGTAWSSYESAAWTRRGAGLGGKANSLERRAALLNLQGNQALTIHTAMFMQSLAAREAGNGRLADFFAERLPPEAKKAYNAWMDQKPFENPAADPHPFVTNLYEVRFSKEADQARAEAAQCVQDAGQAGAVSGVYLSNTVLCASVLFFAGVAGKFEQKSVRRAMFGFGLAVFLFVVIRTVVSLPIA